MHLFCRFPSVHVVLCETSHCTICFQSRLMAAQGTECSKRNAEPCINLPLLKYKPISMLISSSSRLSDVPLNNSIILPTATDGFLWHGEWCMMPQSLLEVPRFCSILGMISNMKDLHRQWLMACLLKSKRIPVFRFYSGKTKSTWITSGQSVKGQKNKCIRSKNWMSLVLEVHRGPNKWLWLVAMVILWTEYLEIYE